MKQSYSVDNFRKYLIHWIVCCDQPFVEIERPELKDLLKLLRPEIVIPSADTVKNDIMKIFKDEHLRLKDMLQVRI